MTRNRKYYQANRERLIAKAKEYRDKNYGRFTCSRLKYHSSVHGRSMRTFSATRTRCEKAGIEFTLTLEWITARISAGVCEITGIPFQLGNSPGSYRNPYGPSLDRKDPRGPYTPENCRMVLWALNMGFSDWGESVYHEIAKAYLDTKLEYDL